MEQSNENTMDAMYQKTAAALRNAHNVVVTAHINPDGDAVGSALGLFHALVDLGKQVRVVLPTASPANMKWMPGSEMVEVFSENPSLTLDGADTIVVLDLNSVSRLKALGVLIRAAQANDGVSVINIDHHIEPEDFADVQLVDISAASTCQMIVDVLKHIQHPAPISAACATCLYTGIVTDTGSFRFPRTTSTLHRTVADLIDFGADPVGIYEHVYNHSPVARMRMLGYALSSMTTHHNGRLCTMVIEQQDLVRFGCTVEDVDGYVQHTLAVDGVEMGMLLVELPGEIKCSFRSKGTAYVNEIAKAYGGGGHVYAAGARVANTSLQDVLKSVIDAAAPALKTDSE